MASNYKHSGKRILVSASGTIAAGALVAQDGFVGVALTSAKSGENLWLGIDGVWNIAVPASTVQGDCLFTTHTSQAIADSTGLTLTRTLANTVQPVVKAVTARDSAGYADVLILAQGAQRVGTQV